MKDQLNASEKQTESEKFKNSEELERMSELINSKTESNHFLTMELETVKQRCDQLECERGGVLEKLTQSAEECKQLIGQLTTASIEVAQLKGEMQGLTRERDSLDENLRKEQTNCRRISQELSGRNEDVVSLKVFQSNQAKELTAKADEIETLRYDCTALQKELSQCSNEKEQLKKGKEELTKKYQRLETSYKDTKRRLGEREKELTDLNKSYSVVSNEAKLSRIGMYSKFTESRDECIDLNRQLMCLSVDVVNLNEDKAKVDQENILLTEKLENQQFKLKEISQELLMKKGEVDKLTEMQLNQANNIQDKVTELKSLIQECTALENKLSQCNVKKERLKKGREELTHKYQTLETFHEITKRKLFEKEVALTGLKRSHSTVTDAMEEKIANLIKKNEELNRESNQSIKELSEWKQECERLNSQLQDLEQVRLQNSNLNQEREKLIGIIQGLQTSVDRLGGELQERRNEANRLGESHSREVSTLENRIGTLREEQGRTLNELTATKQLYGDLQTQLIEKCAEVEEANSLNQTSELNKPDKNKITLAMSVEEMFEHNSTTSLDKEELDEKNRILTEKNASLEEKLKNLEDQLNELCEFQADSSQLSVYATNAINLSSSYASNSDVSLHGGGLGHIMTLQNRLSSLQGEINRLKHSLI